MQPFRMRLPVPCLAGLILAGCGAAPTSVDDLNMAYEAALERTAPLAVILVPGSAEEQQAFARLQDFFTGMTPMTVRARAAFVYAPQAYLNDTLVSLESGEAIGAYFARTAERVERLEVEFLERVPLGIDWYVRWRMTIQAPGFGDGGPVATYGVSQLRFDAQGRLLIHKDFWDAAQGLHEQLPVVGGVVRRVRGAVEAQAR
jgi:hypothetical protein